jgi:UDP-N-acetylmuramate--alanine ligase
MRRIRNIHFTGIGGAGMSGIAEVFHNLNYHISGSDIADSAMVRHLRELGIEVTIGHRRENVADAHVVVVSIIPSSKRRANSVSRWCGAPRCWRS